VAETARITNTGTGPVELPGGGWSASVATRCSTSSPPASC
jgi:hypothetical protein